MDSIDKVKIVVQDENVFGFIYEILPNSIDVVSCLYSKGAVARTGDFTPVRSTMRLAKDADFDLFRVEKTQFTNPSRYGIEYIFER